MILNAPEKEWVYPAEVNTDKTLNFHISEITREKFFTYPIKRFHTR